MSKTPSLIQSVILTFDDDSQAVFTGPAKVFLGDKRRVVNVSFTLPGELPAGYEIEIITVNQMINGC